MSQVTAIGRQPTMVSVSAVVYPACICGLPWTQHRPQVTRCQGYQPSRPIEDRGIVAYSHRRLSCRILERVERWCRTRRTAIEKRG